MNKQRVKEIRNTLNAALKNAICDCTVTVGSIRYGSNNCTVKLEIAEISSTGVVMTKEHTDYINNYERYRLEQSWLNKEVTCDSNIYKIIGLRPRSYKYPVIMEMNGERFKFSAKRTRHIYEHSTTIQSTPEPLFT